ncbi:MAG: vWA domain-containing protein, partial [Eubacteriales bacterium]|nr:vWA domain-containing protein [Eubacteriales bacterium]
MKTAIGDKIKVWLSKSSDSAHSDAVLTNDFKIIGSISAGSVGDKTLTIKYKGGIVGYVTVHVIDANPENAIVSVTPTSGRILVRSGIDASTGSTMTITHASGKKEIVPVTFGMITKKNGEPCNQNTTEGLYEGCSVTYISIDGSRFDWGYDDSADNYTLEVYSNDYPEYPEKGSVILDKNAYDIANVPWYSSGLANVELSVKGIPSERGVDMIVIMDTSGSMNTSISTSTDVTRLDVAKESLINLIQILCADDASGKSKDVQIAIADFNDQTRNPSSSFSFESNNMFGHDTSMDSYPFEEYCPGRLFTGPNAGKAYAEANGYFDASAFVDVQSLSTWTVDNLASMTAGGGTNYDAGLGYALMLARAKQVQNASNGEQRDMVIIFMSDGTPHQYNFFVKAYNQNSSDSTASWTDWIRFTDPDTNGTISLNSGSNTLYMNTANNYRHFYAEALKGAANAQYSIVDMSKNIVGLDTKHIVGDDNMYNINGIGAKLYTIGFALANYGSYGPTATQQASILRGLASEGCFFQAKDASELNEAFDAIAGQTLTAAKYSYFIDTVGDDFDLQTSNHVVDKNTISQKIEVKRYRVVKYSDIGKTLKIGGVSVEITNVNITEYLGKRIDDAVEVIETVTFSADGTQAFSDQILDANGEPINIIDENNIICAKYFRFNLNSESKDVVVPVLNPKTEITDQPDRDHPYVMKSYSFSTDPINDDSGWTREGNSSSSSTYIWQYDSTEKMMYSKGGSSASHADMFISPEFTVPAAGGRFQIQLSNEAYISGNGYYTTPIN